MNKNLLEKALYHFKQFEKEEYVVAPSLPILYFGDTNKYLKSKLKVITVGKNPSNVEFRLNSSEKYSFRHTGAIEIYKRTGSLSKLQKAMGHSSLKVSLTYLRGLEVEDLKEEDMPMI